MGERPQFSAECLIDRARLAAYLDGELPLPEQRDFALHVQTCPRCSAELELERRARTALRAAGARMELPLSLSDRITAALSAPPAQKTHRHGLVYAAVAAAVALVALAGILAIAARQLPGRQALVRVVSAHEQETLSPTPVAYASSDPDTVQRWLERQTGRKVDVPDLSQAGYRLMGARLDHGIGPHAMALVYDGPGGLVTCAILSSTPPEWLRAPLSALEPDVQTASVASIDVATWPSSYGTYVMAGNLPAAALAQLARTARNADSD